MTVQNGILSSLNIASGVYNSATVVLTSAQVKALRATPITIIPAPGAGKSIFVFSCVGKLTYGGNNPFTGTQQIVLRYNSANSNLVSPFLTTTFVGASVNTYEVVNLILSTWTSAQVENLAVTLMNAGASEITGNASNDNTITFTANYAVMTI